MGRVATGAWQRVQRTEVLRFALAASLAAVVNLGTLYLAADVLGVPYVLGSAVAFVAGFVVAFALHKRWTFRDRGGERLPLQVLLSLLLKGVNFATYVGLIYVLVEWFGWWHIHAALVAGAAIPLENFVAFKFLIFRRPESPRRFPGETSHPRPALETPRSVREQSSEREPGAAPHPRSHS